MFETALEGSWAYKEIVEKGLAQGLAQGLEQGLEKGKIQNQRQTLIDYVQVRFPE